MIKQIFIPGTVPSSKNSRILNTKSKRSFPSKTTQTYIKDSKDYWILNKDGFLEMLVGKEKPYLIQFHIVRKTKHRWDFHNAMQVLCDLMTKYGYIDDDNTDEMFPIPLKKDGVYYSYDKDNAGVFISIQ